MIKIKARNASKTQSNRFAHGASFSTAIAKFRNAEIDYLVPKMIGHDLIRGSLCCVIDNRATVLDVVFKFVAEMLDKAPHWHRCRVAQRAYSASFDLVRNFL